MKWMFNTKYGLEDAVLNGTKTSTRREVFKHDFRDFNTCIGVDNHLYVYDGDLLVHRSKCALFQEIKVARRYSSIYPEGHPLENTAGWDNKMFVVEDNLKDSIIITDIHCERIQDIHFDDIMREGIYIENGFYTFRNGKPQVYPKRAFEELIKKVCDVKTWNDNPHVIAYKFRKKG